MARTMFLPTPRTTAASSRVNTVGSPDAASNPFLIHPYRGWKVSWRAKAGPDAATPSSSPTEGSVTAIMSYVGMTRLIPQGGSRGERLRPCEPANWKGCQPGSQVLWLYY